MFRDRNDAGSQLAGRLAEMDLARPVVLALPRGGVPVAAEICRVLKAPLGLLLVRKIGVAGQPELAAGAVVDGEEPDVVINADVVQATGMTRSDIDLAVNRKLAEIEARRVLYYRDRKMLEVAGRTAIIVDDGIATGATVKAGLKALRRRRPQRIVLAVPVAPPETLAELRADVDDIVCLQTPDPFFAISAHYRNFSQVSDAQVVSMLHEACAFEDAEAGNRSPGNSSR